MLPSTATSHPAADALPSSAGADTLFEPLRSMPLVDPEKAGLAVTAFIRVRCDQQDDRHLQAFEQAVAGFAEVTECYLMTGDADYQLRVLVALLGAFEDFLRSRLTRIAGIAQATTSFALRPAVYKAALPM